MLRCQLDSGWLHAPTSAGCKILENEDPLSLYLVGCTNPRLSIQNSQGSLSQGEKEFPLSKTYNMLSTTDTEPGTTPDREKKG